MRSLSNPDTSTGSPLQLFSDAGRRRALIAGLGAALVLGACSTPAPPKRAAPPAPRAPQQKVPEKAPAPSPDARFLRPSQGAVIGQFDGNRNKGIDFAGRMGDPIVATDDGRVVFVGTQLRGYGQVVIVKHDERFISVYAHTNRVLVKEKDEVRRGQQIAEMGDSDADRVKLHFEIRREGVAVNPQPYLDGRQR